MANTTFKDMGFRIDNSTGTLADIKAYLNQQDLKRAISLIEDTAMGSSNGTYIPAIGRTTLSINGMVNTTTDAIFGPQVGAATVTSVSKTFEWKAKTGRFYNGETFLADVTYSGATEKLQTFSANLQITGAVNRTSVALA